MKNRGFKGTELIITIIIIILLGVMLVVERTVPYPFSTTNQKVQGKKKGTAVENTEMAGDLSIKEESLGDDELEALKYERDSLKEQLEIAKEDQSSLYANVPSRVMVGYIPSEDTDIHFINEQRQKYGISPVIILDCSLGSTKLETMMQQFESLHWEIMFRLSMTSDAQWNTMHIIRQDLSFFELQDSKTVLLKKEDVTDDRIKKLHEDGIQAYCRYTDEMIPPALNQEMVAFNDVSIRSKTVDEKEVFSSTIENHGTLLTVFDLSEMRNGNLSEKKMEDTLTALNQLVKDKQLTTTSLKDMIPGVKKDISGMDTQQAEVEENISILEEELEEIEEQIEELEATLK